MAWGLRYWFSWPCNLGIRKDPPFPPFSPHCHKTQRLGAKLCVGPLRQKTGGTIFKAETLLQYTFFGNAAVLSTGHHRFAMNCIDLWSCSVFNDITIMPPCGSCAHLDPFRPIVARHRRAVLLGWISLLPDLVVLHVAGL